MEQFDFLSKEKIVAVLKFGMVCGDGKVQAIATYYDNDFKIDFSFLDNEPNLIVSASIPGGNSRKLDYNLSEMATQYAKDQLKIQQLQSRLKGMAGKFDDISS